MSGAKKKLAQKEAMAQLGLTEKEKRALKEAAAKKRNTILGAILGVVVVVLVAALLVWNSGLIPGTPPPWRSTATSILLPTWISSTASMSTAPTSRSRA